MHAAPEREQSEVSRLPPPISRLSRAAELPAWDDRFGIIRRIDAFASAGRRFRAPREGCIGPSYRDFPKDHGVLIDRTSIPGGWRAGSGGKT